MKSNPLRSNRDAPSRFLKNLKKIWTSRPDLTPRYDKASNKIVRGQIGTGCPSYNRFNAFNANSGLYNPTPWGQIGTVRPVDGNFVLYFQKKFRQDEKRYRNHIDRPPWPAVYSPFRPSGSRSSATTTINSKFGVVRISKFHISCGNVADSYYLFHAHELAIFIAWPVGVAMEPLTS